MVVEAELAGGKTGKFIIDTGASGGLVLKQDALPAETEITELIAEAHSFEGISVSEGKMEGATGDVSDENFLGIATLPTFIMGDMHLQDVETNVVKTFPDFLEKLDITGIIGLDIMKQADILKVEHPNRDKGRIQFLSSGKNKQENFDHTISLFPAANLLFAKGEIQDAPINFLMDSGARRSIMSTGFANDNQIEYSTTGKAKTMGISGNEVDSKEVSLPNIILGSDEFNDCQVLLSPALEITKSMGLESSGVILGMSFYSRFSTVEIDFLNNELRLKK